MLTKEYRIALPLTVEEYRIAQLYMIAKKSREETVGAGSGVEIIVNEPYTDGPGGQGQYTQKVYHVGSHLPGWFKALLPKSVLTVEEEAWNAYPYTKTRYKCPFVEKFMIEIETKYFDDSGEQENVFELTGSELRNHIVDVIDIAKDQLYGADYIREEDPRYYRSQKTCRGPLTENWIEEFASENRNPSSSKPIMCAYKLCRVEFKYWGMQSKIEKFIHEVALRKTMLRAHKQAWCWQDEWWGLSMDDIRRIEKETQELLRTKMAGGEATTDSTQSNFEEAKPSPAHSSGNSVHGAASDEATCLGASKKVSHLSDLPTAGQDTDYDGRRKPWGRTNSQGTLNSPSTGSNKSFDLQLMNWRMESCARNSDNSSDDEFFDAEGVPSLNVFSREEMEDSSSLTKWSSLELFPTEDENTSPSTDMNKEDSIFQHSFLQKMASEQSSLSAAAAMQSRCGLHHLQQCAFASVTTSVPCSPSLSPSHVPVHHGDLTQASQQPCPTSVLILVLHAGSVLDSSSDLFTKKSDVSTFKAAFENISRRHYPVLAGRVNIRLIPCPPVCLEALGVLSSLNPYSFNVSSSPSAIDGTTSVTQDTIPLGAIPIFSTVSSEYQDAVNRTIAVTNQIYHDFLKTEDGTGFNGQVVLIGDSMGSILTYDALCRNSQFVSHFGSETSLADAEPASAIIGVPVSPGGLPKTNPTISIIGEKLDIDMKPITEEKEHRHVPEGHEQGLVRHLSAPANRRRSSSSSEQSHTKFDFEVSDFFAFGSPLGIVIAFRKMHSSDDRATAPPRPNCGHFYNLFHPTDPLSCRVESLLSARFSLLPPVKVPRYAKYPLGDGQPYHLLECMQSNAQVFTESLPCATAAASCNRRMSETSMQSVMSGVVESVPLQTVTALTQKWWGNKRLDYALYCPDGLANFPLNALPHLFHASYWESADVIAFISRQLCRTDGGSAGGGEDKEGIVFSPAQPREKWMKKRTSVKLKNVNANHRANDVILREGVPQVITARFMYGPLDMVALTGEKVDVHIMTDTASGEWTYLSTEVTDKNGRIIYQIPEDKAMGYGMYPVKMIVRGDHTSVDFYLVIVPPRTECVVFSIDGSFTASMSVTGRDPKVRAGAVDVVRHWQELGYLIIYVTARPDMQQQRVVAWLAQHNFPHGLVSFVDGLTTDPLRHKADYLRHLMQEADVVIHAAYGSSKDIAVYSSVGVKPGSIYVVGKASKKQHSLAQVLTDGYAAHLSDLTAHGGSRPAQGNARMVIARGCFGLPGQNAGLRRRRSAKRTPSYPITGTHVPAGGSSCTSTLSTEIGTRTRGVSPRPGSK